VAPSAKLSGTVRSAQTAAQDFPGLDVRIIDTLTVSCNLGALVLEADAMARAGQSADAIEARINALIPRGRLYFVVDTLEYLAKGGRIGGAKALVGELIQIKPVLTIRDGAAAPFEQQRTRKRSIARLEEIAAAECPRTAEAHLAVIQVAAEDEALALSDRLKSRSGIAEVPIYELPPAIVVHGGPGAIGWASSSRRSRKPPKCEWYNPRNDGPLAPAAGSRSSHVRSFQVVHHQTQEGRGRREARRGVHAHHA